MRDNKQTARIAWLRSGAGMRLFCLAAAVAVLAGCQQVPQQAVAPPPAAPPSPPVAPVVPTAASPLQASAIMGLDRGALRKLLGEPRLIRHDAPAEVWQYQTTSCVLDLVLYKQANKSRVVYAEARTPAADPTPTDNCLSDVAATRKNLSNS